MNILGYSLIFLLPLFAGRIIKPLLGKKDAGQIEAYLCGFFLVLFIQGLIGTTGIFLGFNIDMFTLIWKVLFLLLAILYLLLKIKDLICILKNKGKVTTFSNWFSKKNIVFLLLTIVVAALVAVRVVLLTDYLRLDGMEGNVRLIVDKGAIFTYNPYTNQPLELGLINSRKIITLPLFYGIICKMFDLNVNYFLNIFVTCFTVFCCYLAVLLVAGRLIKAEISKIVFSLYFFVLVLSGDYFDGTMVYGLLHRGYGGDIIVAAIALPFVMYLVIKNYQQEKNKEGIYYRIINILLFLVVLSASVFVTTIPKGLVVILLEFAILIITCIIRLLREKK